MKLTSLALIVAALSLSACFEKKEAAAPAEQPAAEAPADANAAPAADAPAEGQPAGQSH